MWLCLLTNNLSVGPIPTMTMYNGIIEHQVSDDTLEKQKDVEAEMQGQLPQLRGGKRGILG